MSLRKLFGACEGTEAGFGADDLRSLRDAEDRASGIPRVEHDELGSAKRCNWITEFSGKMHLLLIYLRSAILWIVNSLILR